MSQRVALTGVKPTSAPHLGNYLGAIRPAIRLTESFDGYYFIADYHALTTVRDPSLLRQSVYDVTATWLASGLDPEKSLIYRQSAIPEVFELSWILSCVVATGQLERGHAYKDALAHGEAPNAGVFYYPVLMAADILLYDANVVPVGSDQKQHLELARDMAQRLNHHYGEGTVVVPEMAITDAPMVPGFDGHKMSKSRNNGIELFSSAKDLKKGAMKFVTGSEPLEAPKDPASSSVFQIYQLVADPARVEAMASKLREGGYGWGHAKQELAEALEAELGPLRSRYEELRKDTDELERILHRGEERARAIAHRTISRVRSAIGIASNGQMERNGR